MNVTNMFVGLTSEQPERLATFYRDVVGLPPKPEFGPSTFHAGPVTLGIDHHSETKGQAKEPARSFLTLFVDDLRAEQDRLEAAGVPFIRKEGAEFWGGVFSTFVDPDGNYCQLCQFDAETGEGDAQS